jgi:hypothetical protein
MRSQGRNNEVWVVLSHHKQTTRVARSWFGNPFPAPPGSQEAPPDTTVPASRLKGCDKR